MANNLSFRQLAFDRLMDDLISLDAAAKLDIVSPVQAQLRRFALERGLAEVLALRDEELPQDITLHGERVLRVLKSQSPEWN